jgi:hypothetical protein
LNPALWHKRDFREEDTLRHKVMTGLTRGQLIELAARVAPVIGTS